MLSPLESKTPYHKKYSILKPYIVLIIASLLFNILLILNDQAAWDGWIISHLIDNNEWGYLFKIYTDIALPQTIVISYIQGLFDDPVRGSQYLNFIFITGSGLALYTLYKKVFSKESSILALITIVLFIGMPNNILYLYGMPHYSFAILSFYLGLNLYLNNKIINKFFGIILILSSFILESLIFFNAALAFILPFVVYNISLNNLTFRKYLIYLKKYIPLVLISCFYFIIKRAIIQPQGVYQNYNNITFSFSLMFNALRDFFENLIFRYNYFLTEIILTKYFFLIFLIAALIYIFAFRKIKKDNFCLKASPKNLFFLAFILFLFGAFPYLVTLKPINASGPGLRHGLLIFLPSVLFLIFLAEVFARYAEHYCKNIRKIIFSFILSSFFVITVIEYSRVISYGIHTQAQIQALKKITPVEKGTVLFVKSYRLSKANYDLALMINAAWGSESWATIAIKGNKNVDLDNLYEKAFSLPSLNKEKKYYGQKDFVNNGCWAFLELWRVGNINITQTIKYFFYRYNKDYNVNKYLKKYGRAKLHKKHCLDKNVPGENNETRI